MGRELKRVPLDFDWPLDDMSGFEALAGVTKTQENL